MNFTTCHRLASLPPPEPTVRLSRKDCRTIFQNLWLDQPRLSNEDFREVADRSYPCDCFLFRGRKQKVWREELEKFIAAKNRVREFSTF